MLMTPYASQKAFESIQTAFGVFLIHAAWIGKHWQMVATIDPMLQGTMMASKT